METEHSQEQDVFSQLTMGWWNTSLSPNGKKRSEKYAHNLQIAALLIKGILLHDKVDFLAIGEVCEADIEYISELLVGTPYRIEKCFEQVGRGFFSQAYIYNSLKMCILEQVVLSFAVVGRNYRAGHALTIQTLDDSKFLVIVSHWPSKLREENGQIRNQLATKIRSYIDELQNIEIANLNVIMMGDFNSEPFESPLSNFLMASRDHNKVSKKPELFYNPFWDKMGMSECSQFCGSYYYKSGLFSYWYLFDQMIFSSAFVTGRGEWRLSGKGVILGSKDALELVTDVALSFDHLPVIAKVEKNNE